jgi:carbonic anhydrase
MCLVCHGFTPDLRQFLPFVAASFAATVLFGRASAFAAGAVTNVTADEAIARLIAANEKYISATELCAVGLSRQREQVAQAQTPWATILTCSDSRVPPELVFADLKLNELFVARNAGNLLDTDTMGTIEYGAEHLGIPLVVVLGHERCGAVSVVQS